MERKLSTILALDVVGFSALMANDEDITLANLRQRRELIDSIIHKYDAVSYTHLTLPTNREV